MSGEMTGNLTDAAADEVSRSPVDIPTFKSIRELMSRVQKTSGPWKSVRQSDDSYTVHKMTDGGVAHSSTNGEHAEPPTYEPLFPAEWFEAVFVAEARSVVPKLLKALDQLATENARLHSLINNPRIDDFLTAVRTESAHQKERWGAEHDKAKTPEDWLWTLAFLATKATQASRYNDNEKYRHHIVTCAALCANWFERVHRGQDATAIDTNAAAPG